MNAHKDSMRAGTRKPIPVHQCKEFAEILKLPDIQQKHADVGTDRRDACY